MARDPQLNTVGQDKIKARFTLAVDGFRNAQAEKQVDFIPVVAWGKQAELVGKYANKGKQIAVCGRLNAYSYDKDGQKQYTMDVVAESIDLLGSANENGNNQGTSKATPKPSTQPRDKTSPDEDEEEDDLPF